jgi:hypothetical protein
MRGPDVMQDTLFAVRSLESYVPTDHPLRPVRDILNEALKRMDGHQGLLLRPAPVPPVDLPDCQCNATGRNIGGSND